jgi:integrase
VAASRWSRPAGSDSGNGRPVPGGSPGRAHRVCPARVSRPGTGLSALAAGLLLDDIDWLAGTVTIRGKGGRTGQLPVPADAGQALAGYLRLGRPGTTSRAVFVRAAAPHTAMRPSSVSCIVARAAGRAGLGTVHGHRLRHTAATQILNAGASLEEVDRPDQADAVVLDYSARPSTS